MRAMSLFRYLILLLLVFFTGHVSTSFADRVCVKANLKRGKVTLTSSTVASAQSCPRGMTELVDTANLIGPQGPAGTNGINGTNGADGSMRIYGDGSAGSVSVDTTTTLSDPNQQYGNLVVHSGVTLRVPSGTVIRSNGTVTIDGTISVLTGGRGGTISLMNSGAKSYSYSPATQGNARIAAGFPEVGSNASTLWGGAAGVALQQTEARSMLRLSHLGCGAGGGGLLAIGGGGGGSLTILAKTGIFISASGSIVANGGWPTPGGGGGGAGGFVVLASSGAVINSGSISVNGANGAPSFYAAGAGGGGGGGIVHMLAPSITSGAVSFAPGSSGSSSNAVTNNTSRSGGGAGGSCGGNGGEGNRVLADNSQSSITPAGAGFLLETVSDPVSLF